MVQTASGRRCQPRVSGSKWHEAAVTDCRKKYSIVTLPLAEWRRVGILILLWPDATGIGGAECYQDETLLEKGADLYSEDNGDWTSLW
jgi:hypothetical protein